MISLRHTKRPGKLTFPGKNRHGPTSLDEGGIPLGLRLSVARLFRLPVHEDAITEQGAQRIDARRVITEVPALHDGNAPDGFRGLSILPERDARNLRRGHRKGYLRLISGNQDVIRAIFPEAARILQGM